jgi:Zn-dependent protease with chaperone function
MDAAHHTPAEVGSNGLLRGGSGWGRLEWHAVGALVLVFGLIAAFFGILMAVVFELFRFVDFLLSPPWRLDPGTFCRAATIGLICVFLGHVAWRLSVALLGVLTPKYDAPPLDNAPVVLARGENSGLYALVEEVCRQVSAPRPDEIRVSFAAECYVAEQRVFSVRPQRRLTLVLGLPQLLIVSGNQLRCIIAHEMAHFRSRDTTVVVFLFRFTESLRRARSDLQQSTWRAADPIYWLFAVAHRCMLRVAQPIQRAQELHADAVSAAVYGGELAVQTLLTDWLLANQFEAAVQEYTVAVANGQVSADVNLFWFFKDRWHAFSAAGRDYLERRLAEEEAGLPGSDRPTFTRRFGRMRTFPAKPLAESPPASELLSNLPEMVARLHGVLLSEPSTASRPCAAEDGPR